MKSTITIEIETEGFMPLYEMVDQDGNVLDEEDYFKCDDPQEGDETFSEVDFHKEILDNLIFCIEERIPEMIMEEKYPDNWEVVSDCCKKLTVKVNGKECHSNELDGI